MDRSTHDTERLCTLIEGHESWLTAHTIEIAKERGYTPFTSTLEGPGGLRSAAFPHRSFSP